jgi:hypothetical protein
MSSRTRLGVYAGLASRLRGYLAETVSLQESRAILRAGVCDREERFLRIARNLIYDRIASPYRSLLQSVGCEYGDLEQMVRSDGLEASLCRLVKLGVYLTSDEFRGRKAVVRGSLSLTLSHSQFDNPNLAGIRTASGGSGGKAMATTMSVDRLHYLAQCCITMLAAHGVESAPVVLWMPALPSAAGMAMLLYTTKAGSPPVIWYSPVSNRTVRPAFSKRLATLYVVNLAHMLGTPLPRPHYLPPECATEVATTIRQILATRGKCVVFSTPSNAVRACHSGFDLNGTTFVVSGEPLSSAKNREIQNAGARCINLYASAECGVVGFGCAGDREHCDDIHVLLDTQAVVTRRMQASYDGSSVDALLFSTLYPYASKVLLNVEAGDFGLLETRTCGCDFESLGMVLHLHSIQSYDKLTGEGVTFVGADIVRIVEELLPARFGGRSTDYQVIEEEDAGGLTHLTVLVAPSVGPVDNSAVVSCVLDELGRGGDTRRMMAQIWARMNTLRVRREHPRVTEGGKLLPLHLKAASH